MHDQRHAAKAGRTATLLSKGAALYSTLRARVIAFLWRNPAYLSVWTDGAICGALLFVIVKSLLEGK
ncbi:MAG: hypothetical protein Q8K21_17265 [Hydrogenophaga sp.]|uniref:hypothetical protein n=1 Tax=Hydrogenophaga sp. TaxID=1904254 RepID=UPI00272F401D|nr:hypothetical protein [Hydrogenophaga sp.]MDP2165931.1 hypothetical protein [Hydrogenophaga sp.]MDP3476174.1 hypothetical protein [Hydrogenophaga sp.]